MNDVSEGRPKLAFHYGSLDCIKAHEVLHRLSHCRDTNSPCAPIGKILALDIRMDLKCYCSASCDPEIHFTPIIHSPKNK